MAASLALIKRDSLVKLDSVNFETYSTYEFPFFSLIMSDISKFRLRFGSVLEILHARSEVQLVSR